MTSIRLSRAAALVASAGFVGAARADVINIPVHPHNGTSVTTWAHDSLPNTDPDPAHRHQHRTYHDPMAGVQIFGSGAGAQAYVANQPGQVWTGRIFTVAGGNHGAGANTEAEHGHQGHEIDFGRFDVHTAVVGGNITQARADAWNNNAAAIAAWGYGLWNAAGTASGTSNWPTTDDDRLTDPNGIAWHSSVDWRSIAFNAAQPAGSHEIHIVLGALGGGTLGSTGPFTGGHNNSLTITMNDNIDWFYSIVNNPAANQYDFASVLLHEQGHSVGLDHFGAGNLSYVMKPNIGTGEVTRVIDPDAVHGVRDLYTITGIPAPGTGALLGLGGLLATRRRRA